MDFFILQKPECGFKRAAPASHNSEFIYGSHTHIQTYFTCIGTFEYYGSFFSHKLHRLGKAAFRTGTFSDIFIAFFFAAGGRFGKGTEKLQLFRMSSDNGKIDTGKSQNLGCEKGQPAVSEDSGIFIRGYMNLCKDFHGCGKRFCKYGLCIGEFIRNNMKQGSIYGHVFREASVFGIHAQHFPV